MKKLLVVFVLALSITGARASEPEVEPAAAATVHIGGKVCDVVTGEALVGVSLKLKGSDKKTYTDLNGNFRIEGVAPGTYDIDVDYVSYKNITLKQLASSSSSLNLKVELEAVPLPL